MIRVGKTMLITKQYLKEQKACIESYIWLERQKKKDSVSIANQLYKEKKYNWCFWLLYRTTTTARVYLWTLIVLSSALPLGISILISNYQNYQSNGYSIIADIA